MANTNPSSTTFSAHAEATKVSNVLLTEDKKHKTQDEEENDSVNLLKWGKQLQKMGVKVTEISKNESKTRSELKQIQAMLHDEQARSAKYKKEVRSTFLFVPINRRFLHRSST